MTILAVPTRELSDKIIRKQKRDESVERALDNALVYSNWIERKPGTDPVISEAVLNYGLMAHNKVAYTDPRVFRAWHAHIVDCLNGMPYTDKLDAYYKVKETIENTQTYTKEELRQAA